MEANNTVNPWDFVAKYYPNYDSSDEIAYANDLQMIIDEVWKESDAATRIFIEELEGDMEEAQREYNRVHTEIYEAAIEAYLQAQLPALVEPVVDRVERHFENQKDMPVIQITPKTIVINGVEIEVGLCEEGEHTDRNYLADFYVDTDEVSGSGYIEQNIRSGNPEVIFNGDFTVVNELALYTHFNNSAEAFEEALIGHYNNLVAQARKK